MSIQRTKRGAPAKKRGAPANKRSKVARASGALAADDEPYLRITISKAGAFSLVEVSNNGGGAWSPVKPYGSSISDPFNLGALRIGEFRSITMFKLFNPGNQFTWFIKEPPVIGSIETLGGHCPRPHCNWYVAPDEFYL